VTKESRKDVADRAREVLQGAVEGATPGFCPEKCPGDLTEKQYFLLWQIYHTRPFKVKDLGVSEQYNKHIPYGSVKNYIEELLFRGYLEAVFLVSYAGTARSTAVVNKRRCLPVLGPTAVVNEDQLTNDEHRMRTIGWKSS